ncbi:MAG: hypothetical protein WCI75_15195 [candidate division NC10 bacterium]
MPCVGHSGFFRYARRAFYVIDRQGTVRFMKINENALDLLTPEELLKALKESGT